MRAKDFIDVLSALLTPVVALATILLAVFQYRRNRLKSRHELYDRRLAIYKAVLEFIGSAVSEANVTRDEQVKFAARTGETTFLFDRDIAEYIEELRAKARKLSYSTRRVSDSHLSDAKRDELLKENDELIIWFDGEFSAVSDRFSKYLSIKSYR